MASLKFQPFTAALDVGFLTELGRRKLHEFGLSDAPVEIRGSYARAERHEIPSPFCVGADAFLSGEAGVPPTMCVAPGTLLNVNTLEDFKELDKTRLLDGIAQRIWEDMKSGEALERGELMLRFVLLTFADLKSHKYIYWFAFPALVVPAAQRASPPVALASLLSDTQRLALREGFASLSATRGRAPAFFAVRVDASGTLEVGPLSAFADWAAANTPAEAWLAFCDPCPLLSNPGWPLRNLLALLTAQQLVPREWPSVRILAYREPHPGAAAPALHADGLGLPPPPRAAAGDSRSVVIEVHGPFDASPRDAPPPKAVGWSLNSSNKAGPRQMDLSAQMDPEALAEASVDLNLRLMRWRLMPQLDNEAVAATSCLLVGAGTLGCAVARCLLGWGVRTITFVDSGVVAYSNPVRQSLFTFEDCIGGDTPKAEAAAAALRRIFPCVHAGARRIGIPMPGHPVSAAEASQVGEDARELERMVEAHDVIFLLTDTRESRWLPTLLAAAHRKLALTVALGFDSLVVMRHGMPAEPAAPPASRLGCYFCNDVVGPANSMLRRTLDQQCTVSRPGLAMVASALAVELMVTLLHHPRRGAADADLVGDDEAASGEEAKSPLGGVPHQIRGSLPLFRTTCMRGSAFDRCTACSATVVDAFREKGVEFLMSAFNSSSYLEDLTGLTEMHRETEAKLEEMAGLASECDGEDDF